jgi:hypothetical protein
MTPPSSPFLEKQTTGHPCLLGSRLRYWLCVRPFLSAHLYLWRAALASTYFGKYSLFCASYSSTLTGSDESAMNLAAHVTILKDLLKRLQEDWH